MRKSAKEGDYDDVQLREPSCHCACEVESSSRGTGMSLVDKVEKETWLMRELFLEVSSECDILRRMLLPPS
jgi:hypothetical protein